MASQANTGSFSNSTTFGLLDEGGSRLPSFGLAIMLQCLALLLLISLPLLMPQRFQAAARYWATPVSAPPIVAWKPQPVRRPQPIKRIVPVQIPKPQIVAPPVKLIAPVFNAAKPVVRPKAQTPNLPNIDKPEVSNFSMGSSAIPTLQRPRDPVQTGGFGDPDSVAANDAHHVANMTQLGAYDMPNGAGQGNGNGGAKGARGVVASTGFGNSTAAGAAGPAHGSVQQGLFSDEHAAAQPAKTRTAIESPVAQPVEITSKPRPVYTDEAKALKIEGEVLLQVVFTASGQVQVQKVVKGLGHGLDESATAAARAIRFNPARNAEGQPVDSMAVVHIVFQLAY